MRIALYQPDIPQNTGTILRMAACLDVAVDVIGPAGFDLSTKALRRAGMDYLEKVDLNQYDSWEEFIVRLQDGTMPGQTDGSGPQLSPSTGKRLILLTTRGQQRYIDFKFSSEDILLLGRESAGVPQNVHNTADARLVIPLKTGLRSLNIAMAAAMVLGEALRQTKGFPASTTDNDP